MAEHLFAVMVEKGTRAKSVEEHRFAFMIDEGPGAKSARLRE